ncbi:hypothetical protein G7054_g8490 [Neopestalotiopsis clavispora]|nr:hypothetical protein G7054_g8490 [Neopestalotiopsis clavispora]
MPILFITESIRKSRNTVSKHIDPFILSTFKSFLAVNSTPPHILAITAGYSGGVSNFMQMIQSPTAVLRAPLPSILSRHAQRFRETTFLLQYGSFGVHDGKSVAGQGAASLPSLDRSSEKPETVALGTHPSQVVLKTAFEGRGQRSALCKKACRPPASPILSSMVCQAQHVIQKTYQQPPFLCVTCGRNFTTKDSLRRHYKTVHTKPESPFYWCRCEKKDTRKDNHLRHVDSCTREARCKYLCKCNMFCDNKDCHVAHVRACTYDFSKGEMDVS